jgi:hypothetical protein
MQHVCHIKDFETNKLLWCHGQRLWNKLLLPNNMKHLLAFYSNYTGKKHVEICSLQFEVLTQLSLFMQARKALKT